MKISKQFKGLIKSTALTVLLFATAQSISAQGFYGGVNVGYGFPLGSQQAFGMSNTTSSFDYFSYEPVFISFAEGIYFGATGGYMFNANVGVDLGLNYLIGNSAQSVYQTSYSEPDNEYRYTQTTIVSGNMLRVTPSLVVRAGTEKLNPYAKLGVVIGFANVEIEDNSSEYENYFGDINQSTSTMTMDLNEGVAIGLSSALGALFTVSDRMSFFAEINMVNMSYAPNKGMVTGYIVDGVDLMGSLTTSEKEVEFVDKITQSGNAPPNENEPSQVAKANLPFGSYGLNIGVIFSF